MDSWMMLVLMSLKKSDINTESDTPRVSNLTFISVYHVMSVQQIMASKNYERENNFTTIDFQQ